MTGLALSLAEIAQLVAGELHCDDPNLLIEGVQTLINAAPSQATFLSNMKYKTDLELSQAGLVLMTPDMPVPEQARYAVIRLKDPYVGFAKLQRYFAPQPVSTGQVHVSAVIDDSAILAADVQVDALVVIAAGAELGAGSIIGAGCIIGEGVMLGEGCLLHPRVVLEPGTILGKRVIVQAGAVLGSDGFGFAWTGESFLKIPQVGRVVVHDDVEIGANTCVDRGAIDDTVIGAGAKLDNLVQIGHNVQVGEKSVFAGQVGISGSTVIGRGCQFGGQAGVAGHVHLADGAIIGAKAGVISDVKQAGMVSGFPAVPHRHWLKASALFDRLPVIWNKIKHLG